MFLNSCSTNVNFNFKVLGVFEWDGNNPLPPEIWLLPYILPIHPGSFCSLWFLICYPLNCCQLGVVLKSLIMFHMMTVLCSNYFEKHMFSYADNLMTLCKNMFHNSWLLPCSFIQFLVSYWIDDII